MISSRKKPPRQKTTAKPKANAIGVSPILMELAHAENSDVFAKLKTSSNGLSRAAVEAHTVEYGPNDVAIEKQGGWLSRLFKATRNLLVILLAILATVSFSTGDLSGGTVMTLMRDEALTGEPCRLGCLYAEELELC